MQRAVIRPVVFAADVIKLFQQPVELVEVLQASFVPPELREIQSVPSTFQEF